MKQMSAYEIKLCMLQELASVVNYCNKNYITYVLTGGTLLGAARHNGFIPWDNDVDIMMPYPDYTRFRRLVQKKEINKEIYVSTFYNQKTHYWPMTKIFLKSTYLIEKNVKKIFSASVKDFCGVYIDVFPAYALPNDFNERKNFCLKLGELWTKWRIVTKGLNHPKNQYISYDESLISDKQPREFIFEMEKMINEYDFNFANYFGCAIGSVSDMRDVFKTDEFQQTKLMPFESIQCRVFNDYDKMLRQFYGDYMVIPPVEQQIKHTIEAFYR